ncbi:hypothetical protein TSUD_268390 [Trifolium subterraneum]|uniref:Uncharacterized protein n=1 Tax=Trifolium subterraneum TaxID=3900 RepID=A0A2Z6P9P0_TRISU|nr:hypothetical protein TSUD_268390 [Trifolium subterraneum]
MRNLQERKGRGTRLHCNRQMKNEAASQAEEGVRDSHREEREGCVFGLCTEQLARNEEGNE